MAARAGITRSDVVATALAMLDEGSRPSDVGLGAVARRLGIRPQSLYAHVDGADGLERAIAAAGLEALGEVVATAAIGVAGPDAAEAIVRAHLAFAEARPSVYAAAIHPPGDDAVLAEAIARAGRPLEVVLASLGMDESERVHWTRLFLSSVYGYAVLRRDGRFALPIDITDRRELLVAMLRRQLPVGAVA